jgi:hypothetical protein
MRRLAGEIQDAIILHGSSKRREVPGQAKPYMALIQSFVESLGPDDKSSYNYIAFYSAGSYRCPVAGDARMEEKAKIFLRVLRPESHALRDILRGHGGRISMDAHYRDRRQAGKENKAQVRQLSSLRCGSLAIGIYELLQR